MTITVSISEFRQNLSDYLNHVQRGNTVVLKDEKSNREVAELVGKKTWDPEAFRRALKRAAGTFTAKNHPEWATKKKVEQWLSKSRAKDDRTF